VDRYEVGGSDPFELDLALLVFGDLSLVRLLQFAVSCHEDENQQLPALVEDRGMF
jgi:hypothetical protein